MILPTDLHGEQRAGYLHPSLPVVLSTRWWHRFKDATSDNVGNMCNHSDGAAVAIQQQKSSSLHRVGDLPVIIRQASKLGHLERSGRRARHLVGPAQAARLALGDV